MATDKVNITVNSEAHAHNAVGIFNTAVACESVVENSLLTRRILMTIRLDEEFFQRKAIITNVEQWNGCSVIREGFMLREVKPVLGHPQLQVAVVQYLGITRCPIGANVQPDEFIVCINHSHYDDRMELLVVIKIISNMGWLLHSNKFPINSPKNMLKIPMLSEGICNGVSVSL